MIYYYGRPSESTFSASDTKATGLDLFYAKTCETVQVPSECRYCDGIPNARNDPCAYSVRIERLSYTAGRIRYHKHYTILNSGERRAAENLRLFSFVCLGENSSWKIPELIIFFSEENPLLFSICFERKYTVHSTLLLNSENNEIFRDNITSKYEPFSFNKKKNLLPIQRTVFSRKTTSELYKLITTTISVRHCEHNWYSHQLYTNLKVLRCIFGHKCKIRRTKYC